MIPPDNDSSTHDTLRIAIHNQYMFIVSITKKRAANGCFVNVFTIIANPKIIHGLYITGTSPGYSCFVSVISYHHVLVRLASMLILHNSKNTVTVYRKYHSITRFVVANIVHCIIEKEIAIFIQLSQ